MTEKKNPGEFKDISIMSVCDHHIMEAILVKGPPSHIRSIGRFWGYDGREVVG